MRAETAALEALRIELRAWLSESCPPSMRTPPEGEEAEVWGGRRAVFHHPDQRVWLERAAARDPESVEALLAEIARAPVATITD